MKIIKLLLVLSVALFLYSIVEAKSGTWNRDVRSRLQSFQQTPLPEYRRGWGWDTKMRFLDDGNAAAGCDTIVLIERLLPQDPLPTALCVLGTFHSQDATNDDLVGSLLCDIKMPEITKDSVLHTFADTAFPYFYILPYGKFRTQNTGAGEDSSWARCGQVAIAATNDTLTTGQANFNGGYAAIFKLIPGTEYRLVYKPTANADSLGYVRLVETLIE